MTNSGEFVIVDNNLDYETNCWLIGIGVDGNQVGANDPTRQCCGTHLAIVSLLSTRHSSLLSYCHLLLL